MRKLKIYLDSSLLAYAHAGDHPEKRDITLEFLETYLKFYDVYISDLILAEIEVCQNTRLKSKLLDIVKNFSINLLEIKKEDRNEIFSLAKSYVSHDMIPAEKYDDSIHLALCTLYDFDVFLSWNFKGISNLQKQILINNINKEHGYLKDIYLLNPMEVIFEIEENNL